MKYIRLFPSASIRDAVLAEIKHGVLSYTEGEGVLLKAVAAPLTPTVDPSTPFYIEDISGSANTVKIKKSASNAPTLAIEKSTDGNTWESMGSTTTSGITATIPGNGKLYLRCSATTWATSSSYYNTISVTGDCNVGGNTMSLLYGKNFTGNETTFPNSSTNIFARLFYKNTHIINASDLLLPATTLADSCYDSMFSGCTALTTAPALPATTLANDCYYQMFQGCSSLTTAPALPATTLANSCYDSMFNGCTSLTTAPALPATTVVLYCYENMFNGCTSLTTAPALPATTLVNSCYYAMFYGCTKLNYIKCLATNISASGCLSHWVQTVAANGTFVKDPNMSSWTTGANGIPSGWTVKDVGSISLSQELNVATIKINDLDEGTGYYTINGGSHISVGNGTTTIPITQEMNGRVLSVHGEFSGEPSEETLTLSWIDYSPSVTITETKNYVTINSPSADVIKYRLGSSGSFTTYTEPVYINANTTIYVQATKTVSGVDYTTNTSQDVTHEVIPPTNLVISCASNKVTITADNATTIEYNFDGSSTYTTYTEPFAITQTVTVYAKATNADGSITGLQECVYSAYNIPFYIEDISGSANTVKIKKSGSNAPNLLIEKSTDGKTWETMGTTSTTAIAAIVPGNGKLYLRCKANAWAKSLTNYNTISVTGDYNVGGNTMSLLYGSSFTGNETTFRNSSNYIFAYLFYKDTHIINASDLLLPATTLAYGCYRSMFFGCTSLTSAPALPATTLANNCYQNMFSGCKALTTAPELPATTLANNCYDGMFQVCTALTTAPALPATTLADSCYMTMFNGCTSLTTVPELPATALVNACYRSMFNGCTMLNYIKCLATNISATYCIYEWVNKVASTGTFVKNPKMSSWTTGVSGIPSGWTVKDAGGISLEQNLNVATIKINNLDEGTGYYTINGGSHISVGNGKTTIPITQEMNGQVLLVHGEFSGEPSEETLTLSWTDYSPSVTITEANNYVTITSATADTVQYRLGSSGSYTTYTAPVYISVNTTIYVQATKTVSGVEYTTNTSQDVTHEVIPPTNLVISCTNNFVTITATGADTLEYNMNGGTSSYTAYTEPFHITESGTVNARATNTDGSITASQAVTYIDYRPTINITEANNFVTVTAAGANTILYRLGTIGEYAAYTGPVYIAENTTIYVQATRTVAGVDYTSTTSQEVTHELIPPTNLVISCASNTVTITADNATTIEYNFDGSSTYTAYTEPFKITQTVTVYAKATNADGSITGSQECEYSAIPFAENLVFYAPLTEGDLTDHISGKSPSTDSGCTVTWNSTYNMYELYCYGGDYRAALRWVGLSLYDAGHNISTDGLTVTARMKFVSQSGNNYSAFYACDSLKDTFGQYTNNKSYLYTCNARYPVGLGSEINRITTTLTSGGSNNMKFYKNSTLASSINWSSISATRAPDTLSLCERHTNNTNMTILISDVRVYNRVLSASEIGQL